MVEDRPGQTVKSHFLYAYRTGQTVKSQYMHKKVAIQMGSKIRLLHLHSQKLENRIIVRETKPRRSYQRSSCRSFEVSFVKFD